MPAMEERGSRRFPADSSRASQADEHRRIYHPPSAAAGIGLDELTREVIAFQRAATPLTPRSSR
jgi:hypothetical protein